MSKSTVGFICFMLGMTITSVFLLIIKEPLARTVVGARVLKTNCTDTHCSVLVEKKDQSREWLYIEKAIPKVGR